MVFCSGIFTIGTMVKYTAPKYHGINDMVFCTMVFWGGFTMVLSTMVKYTAPKYHGINTMVILWYFSSRAETSLTLIFRMWRPFNFVFVWRGAVQSPNTPKSGPVQSECCSITVFCFQKSNLPVLTSVASSSAETWSRSAFCDWIQMSCDVIIVTCRKLKLKWSQ